MKSILTLKCTEGTFPDTEDQAVFEDYMRRTFYQFRCELKILKPADKFLKELIV